MLFPEEDAPQLKTWIVKRIENTSDADSDVLADYVIALLKHDGSQADIRKLCEEEIPDFLTEDPKAFLDDVFQAIDYKSYLPGAPQAPKPGSKNDLNSSKILPAKPPSSKKRGFDDSAAFQDEDAPSEPVHKQPRRGSRRNVDTSNTVAPSLIPNFPQFDFTNPMEALMGMQAMGMPFPLLPDYTGHVPGSKLRKRKRCRDFDNKGFCSRGSSCLFDHGQESLYSDGLQDYDVNSGGLGIPQIMPRGLSMFGDAQRGGKSGRGGKKPRGGKHSKGSRAPFSAEGPVSDRSRTKIVIENIPQEYFSQDQVRTFFGQFGKIDKVTMQPHKQIAVVQYDSWDSANLAYNSPKVIFDNRFVKVFWHKEEVDKQRLPGSNFGTQASYANDDTSQAECTETEEFQRRQEEAQKLHEEKKTKRSELEIKRQELEKKQQELLAKHRAETERLQMKLLGKSSASGGDGGDATLEDGTPSGSTDMLKAKLALLEQEAKILGIDPENLEEEDVNSSAASFRGGYRGRGFRGRGGYSRGGYALRGRGSFRGSGTRHAAYAQYSIDNRPRKIAITGVDFTVPAKDEALRQSLLSNGEFESVESSSDKTIVSFPDRKTAEMFFFSLQGKELPAVSGHLELEWVGNNTSPSSAWLSAGQSAGNKGGLVDGDGINDVLDAAENGDNDTTDAATSRAKPPPREVDMDYEMPDDEPW